MVAALIAVVQPLLIAVIVCTDEGSSGRQQLIYRLQTIFNRIDVNKDGQLDVTELRTVLHLCCTTLPLLRTASPHAFLSIRLTSFTSAPLCYHPMQLYAEHWWRRLSVGGVVKVFGEREAALTIGVCDADQDGQVTLQEWIDGLMPLDGDPLYAATPLCLCCWLHSP